MKGFRTWWCLSCVVALCVGSACAEDDPGLSGSVGSATGGSGAEGAGGETTTSTESGMQGGLAVSVAPTGLILLPGGSATTVVEVVRSGGFDEDVIVEVSGLVAGVTASPLTIAAGEASGDLVLSADAGALPALATASVDAADAGSMVMAQAPLDVEVRGLPGTLDTSFANGAFFGGIGLTADRVEDAALQADGKIVVAGRADTGSTLLALVARYDESGALDPTFDGDGKVFAPGSEVIAVAIQADGKIVVGFDDYNVTRLNSDGSLDTGFGTGGTANPVAGFGGSAQSLAIQPEGGIIVVGSELHGTDLDGIAIRLDASGGIDTSFGTNGTYDVGYSTANYDEAFEVLVQTSNGATDAIYVMSISTTVNDESVVVRRIYANGNVPATYGPIGVAFIDLTGVAEPRAVLQPDDKIVIGCAANNDVVLARFTEAGDLDPSFNGTGSLTTSFETVDYLTSLAVQGTSILAGGIYPAGFRIARFTDTGTLDATFGTAGEVITYFNDFSGHATALLVQADGRIVAGGSTFDGTNEDFALARYVAADGALDTTFDTDGRRTDNGGAGDDRFNAAVVQPDGKIVLGGSTFNGNTLDMLLVRVDATGAPDPTFDGDGFAVASTYTHEEVNALVLQPDGYIVAVGTSRSPGAASGAAIVARFAPDGTLDTTFSGDGYTGVASSREGHAVALQSDGKILVAGMGSSFDFLLARLNSDGSPDGAVVMTDFGINTKARGVLVTATGDIVQAGHETIGGDFMVSRRDGALALDMGFDGDGRAAIDVGGTDDALGLGAQSSGALILAGHTLGTTLDIALVRLDGSGAPDATFGTAGQVVADPTAGDESFGALLVAPDDRLTIVGSTEAGDFLALRFEANGTTDTIFGGDGTATFALAAGPGAAHAVARMADGRIIIAGETSSDFVDREYAAIMVW